MNLEDNDAFVVSQSLFLIISPHGGKLSKPKSYPDKNERGQIYFSVRAFLLGRPGRLGSILRFSLFSISSTKDEPPVN